MRTIYHNESNLGGKDYRVTGDRYIACLQSRKAGCTKWQTFYTVDRDQFDEAANYHDIYNPYNQNPSHIVRLYREFAAL